VVPDSAAGCLINNDTLSPTEQVDAVGNLFGWHPELMSHAFVRRFYCSANPQLLDELR